MDNGLFFRGATHGKGNKAHTHTRCITLGLMCKFREEEREGRTEKKKMQFIYKFVRLFACVCLCRRRVSVRKKM